MATPALAPRKAYWPNLLGKELQWSLQQIRADRPDITFEETLDLAEGETPTPVDELEPGTVRVIIYYGLDTDDITLIVEDPFPRIG
ncbi:hypothetical protein BDA96_04G206700 [Sorghum bicolor]|jgi:hypothetical protein|uniref:Uncharacterized protein n=2 Tax=Sorghum bicolor TaxID=4558 RepID=A0A921UJB8_SORBI|nr:hypothetical protein BDA96_04G206700 [Sorghum bicolor]KXG30511.1 hypothetical protein SORBI_3004G194200 [Sorghum bicolor]